MTPAANKNKWRIVNEALPQQKLLLELLVMSGDIAVADDSTGTILERTLNECLEHGWIETRMFGAGFHKISITSKGRDKTKPR